MKLNRNEPAFLIVLAGVIFTIGYHLDLTLQVLQWLMNLAVPFAVGLLFAFVLNAPVSGLYRFFIRKAGMPKTESRRKALNLLCLLLTISAILLVIAAAVTMFIPALVTSVSSVIPLIREKLPVILESLEQYGMDVSTLSEMLNRIDFKALSSNAGSLVTVTLHAASITISGFTDFLIGVVIGIYVLLSRQMLHRNAEVLMKAFLKEKTAARIRYTAKLIQDTYTRFLCGQCLEACILGFLIFAVFSVLHLPYAGLVGFLTGIFAFVPYIGAFVSCLIGAFLTLLASPSQVIICVIAYLAVQFVENQFIYPHVVGNSVGLAPLWTLMAALLGGSLFGLPGIIFFIPLTAVVYTLIREAAYRRLKKTESFQNQFFKK